MTGLRQGRPVRVVVAVAAALALVLTGCDSSTATKKPTPSTSPLPARPAAVRAACDGTLGVASTPGSLASSELDETSGLVVSAENPGTLWVHNDSGDSARVFAVSPTGALEGIYPLAGASAIDWEDIAIGPGPEPNTPYLYVGDIGDNDEARSNIVVYRVAEPNVVNDGGTHTLSGVDALTLQYPDGPHNSEALMVDPRSGELFLIVKHLLGGAADIFHTPAGLTDGSTTVLTRVGRLELPPGFGNSVTAADVSRDGSTIGVRSYGAVRLWSRGAQQTVIAALGAEPCQGPVPVEIQGEALGFQPDGHSYFTVSEGVNVPLHEFAVPKR